MLLEVPAPNVDDEGDAWTQGHQIGEVLVGTDAEVRTAGAQAVEQAGNDMLEGEFVGDEVVPSEVAPRLGHAGDQRPEVGVADPLGDGASVQDTEQRRSRESGRRRQHGDDEGHRGAPNRTGDDHSNAPLSLTA
ncbi:MAG: hypothetical protein IPJ11_17515 [Gemmatimonadetes bacterium]|nr:hypothetical protein [Gemmatimonadota bacterium]